MASSLVLYLGTLVAETKGWHDDSRLQKSREEEGFGELLSDPGARQLASLVPKSLPFLCCLPSL